MNTPDWQGLPTDPLLLAYLRRSTKMLGQKYGAPQVNTPSQVVGEQRAMALMMKQQESELVAQGRTGRSLGDDLLAAVPFLWLNDLDPYIKTFTLPRHSIGTDIAPYDRCWWTFQGGHPIENTETGVRLGLADGFIIVKSSGTFDVGVMGQSWPMGPGSHGGLMLRVRFQSGQIWPDDIPVNDRPTVGEVLSRLAFLRAPFVESVVERPHPRHHGKLRPRNSPEGVRFIRLRSSLPEAHPASEHQSLVEWQHQWLVRGHLRAQWYPKAKEHRLIWISPYAKGPEDKPFKSPVYAVVR